MSNTLYTRSIVELLRRQCNSQGDCAAMPVSTWQKTGIPVLISLVLFFAVFVVLFFIVRKRRVIVKKREEEAAMKIDLDDVEDRAAYIRQYGGGKK